MIVMVEKNLGFVFRLFKCSFTESYKMRKDLHEYSVLCKLVRQYGDKFSSKFDESEENNFKANKKLIKDSGWKSVCQTDQKTPFGYFGVAYRRGNVLVIAHRGTQFYEYGNIAADLLLSAQCDSNPILDEATAFCTRCIGEAAQHQQENVQVVHVGFSLGGYIAGTMAARSDHHRAYTFDAPGVVPSDYKPGNQNLHNRVSNYFLKLNLVNTCNQHNGEKYQLPTVAREQNSGENCVANIPNFFKIFALSDSRSDLDDLIASGQTPDAIMRLKFEITSTFESHKVERFIDCFADAYPQPSTRLRKIHSWPIAQIEFLRGERVKQPAQPKSMSEILVFFLQGVVDVFAKELFKISHNGENGIIGMKYQRKNTIVYSDEVQNQPLQQLICLIVLMVRYPNFRQRCLDFAPQFDGQNHVEAGVGAVENPNRLFANLAQSELPDLAQHYDNDKDEDSFDRQRNP